MKYVIVGASAAGINAITTIRDLDPGAEIVLVSTDEHIYSRCILHHYIEGKRDIPQLSFTDAHFAQTYQVQWLKNTSLQQVDTTTKTLTLSDGQLLSYDKLLLATGASTFLPPIEGLTTARNVTGLRNLDDATFIKDSLPTVQDVVVIGAGLVGIDAISGMLHHDKRLTLVEASPHMLSMQLDSTASQRYQDAFAQAGVRQYYATTVTQVISDDAGAVSGVLLSTGEQIPCQLLIVAAGVRANVGFLANSPIACDKFGLLFNALGQTNVADVYGAGDISGRSPIWPSAVKEGMIAGANMVGVRRELTDFFASKSTMNFLDIATLSLGTPNKPDDTYEEVIQVQGDSYKKIIHKEGIIVGAIIQGDLAYAGVLTQLIKEKIDISRVKKPLFSIDYADFFNLTDDLQFRYDSSC